MTNEYNEKPTAEKQSGITQDASRRRILAASAVLGTGAFATTPLAAASGDEDHAGHDHGDDDETSESGAGERPPEGVQNDFANDIEVLNYALTLEYLEAEFYARGLRNIDEEQLRQQFEGCALVQDRVVDRLEVIRNHENTHAAVIAETVRALGGDPVAKPEFDFGAAVQDPAEFIGTAAVLEDVGVSAYAGAAPSIENQDLVPAALSIHSVEARHASFARELSGQIGFPEAFDDPRSRAEVLEMAGGFIVG